MIVSSKVNSIIKTSSESFRAGFSKLGIKILEEIDGNIPRIHADPKRLMQVFHNILENALSFSPKGSVVYIRCMNKNDAVIVEVEDEGPGIPEKERARIFNRFYRVDPSRSRNTGGSGLGLAICSRILQAHGAVISAENGKKGALFRIVFPVENP